MVCQFAMFARARGASGVDDCVSHTEAFAQHWLAQHSPHNGTEAARCKVAREGRPPLTQLLQIACSGTVHVHRPSKPFPFQAEFPGFEGYLRQERGLSASSLHHYQHYLNRFATFLAREHAVLRMVSPALLSAFIVAAAPTMRRYARRNLCGTLRVLLRYGHREGYLADDLSGAVAMPQAYSLAEVPRAITWEEVRQMLAVVDRRTSRGRRDYAILLLLVTYGLRAYEVANLTLDDLDWPRERVRVAERKAGHSTVYPLAGIIAEAVIDYLKHGRPTTADRHVFFRVVAPQRPLTRHAVSCMVGGYLHQAGIQVARAGSHTLRHTCVQRLVDADFAPKVIGDYVGHRSVSSTRGYAKVDVRALRDIALGDGEAL